MKKIVLTMLLLCTAVVGFAQQKKTTQNFGNGFLKVTPVARNAVRIQYYEKELNDAGLPDWLYEGRATAVDNTSFLLYRVDFISPDLSVPVSMPA